jgi:hypothetical protein
MFLVLILSCKENREDLVFDSVNWRNADSTTRFRMVDDLFVNYKMKIIGSTKDDVIALLGAPDHDTGENKNFKDTMMIYDITDTTYSQCPCLLDIHIDSTGIVTYMSWRDM